MDRDWENLEMHTRRSLCYHEETGKGGSEEEESYRECLSLPRENWSAHAQNVGKLLLYTEDHG